MISGRYIEIGGRDICGLIWQEMFAVRVKPSEALEGRRIPWSLPFHGEGHLMR